jgi:hypothetical protein
MSRHRTKATFKERGQILVMSALVMLVLVAAIGLAIDLGRIFIARAELVRAVDAAALAGTLELPNLQNAQDKVEAYMHENEPDALVDAPISPVERQIKVTGTKTVPMFFMKIFGFGSVDVTAHATAGYGVLAVDTVLTIDRTTSMGWGANCPDGAGCPIKEAKDAAKNFTDTLLSGSVASSDTLVGVAPYSNCYQPPWIPTPGPTPTRTRTPTRTPTPRHGTPTPTRTPTRTPTTMPTSTPATNLYCTPGSMVVGLSNDKSLVQSKIDAITADGSTNICLGLDKAADGSLPDHSDSVLFAPGHHTVSNTLRIVVLLSDGQNWYTGDSYDGQGQPPVDCRPITSPSQSDSHTGESPNGSECYSAQTRQRELDVKTMAMADSLRANGVEVYVVGFSVCGAGANGDPNPSQGKTATYCSGIGNTNHDNTANRRLLKCVASSTTGTNDHYFEVASAEDLPDTFANIARLIGFRLIE